MNKTLTITAIVLVAVVMGMGMIAPAMADHNRGHTQHQFHVKRFSVL